MSNYSLSVSKGACSSQMTTVVTEQNNDCNQYAHLNNIEVPCALKRRGRPKGSDKTMIGLSKKSKPVSLSKKIPFKKIGRTERAMFILRWFVDDETVVSAVRDGIPIEEQFVEIQPAKVSDCIQDEDVNIFSVKEYFTEDAWKVVEQLLYYKKADFSFLCAACTNNLDGVESIGCDYCLAWYHLSCASLKKPPDGNRIWKCSQC